jgi:hypothetical protein
LDESEIMQTVFFARIDTTSAQIYHMGRGFTPSDGLAPLLSLDDPTFSASGTPLLWVVSPAEMYLDDGHIRRFQTLAVYVDPLSWEISEAVG